MANKKPSISAFFPAYNDGGTIASMVVMATVVLQELTDDFEVIVVNDGSQDFTGDVLKKLEESLSHVRIVTHKKNRGYGGALRTGFKSATKDLIFYTDGDAQYDVQDLRSLYAKMTDDVDMVQGYKISRNDPWYRKIIGPTYHFTVKTMFGLHLRDVDCDFRLIRREVFDKVRLTRNSGVICVELMKKIEDNGFTIAEVPVGHYHRAYGQSQFFNFKRIWRTGVDLVRLWQELVVRKEHLADSPTQHNFVGVADPRADAS